MTHRNARPTPTGRAWLVSLATSSRLYSSE